MGKLLHLGTRLKYPLTVNKLLKKPGDKIQKQEPILQFKFTWKQKVGDPFGEEWEEDQVTIVDWDSPADGSIKLWKVYEGMTIAKDMPFVEIEESCPHSVQFAGLCGICGKDMTEVSWASMGDDTDHAKIKMIHDQTALTVSESEASKAEEELQRRLLKHRKLSLVVDLDQTIIHACIEPTVGEWQNDPSSPNYEAVKEVKSFQLNDDGPRGVASGCWYYIKMRPGLESFLNKISEVYELHVYTMGTRAYAMNIAKIVDPDKRLFGDRIISRDENGSITTKSLSRLFPVNTKMVVIIDDRADVWPHNRPNLIKVVPYDFFLGVGDINSSFLPKREELPKVVPVPDKKQSLSGHQEHDSKAADPDISETSKLEAVMDEEKKIAAVEPTSTKISALEELVRMGGGDDQALRLEQTAEQEKLLEKQLNERPLLHMQEKLDKGDTYEEIIHLENPQNGEFQGHADHRQNLLKDDDVELEHLERHLIQLHQSFYEEYDKVKALVNEKSGYSSETDLDMSLNKEFSDLNIVPDIGEVMPRLKVNKNSTHLVASISRTRTNKVRQALKHPHIKIVNQDWLLNSISKWEKEDEEPYLVHIHEEDRIRDWKLPTDPSLLSAHPSYDSDSSQTGDESEDTTSVSRDEILDEENLMPSKMGDEYSPIDDLKGFDWSKVDDELAEFMGEEDSENDSDASDSTRLDDEDITPSKRKHEEVPDGEHNENESILAKKQKLANERKTGLNAVDTPLDITGLTIITPRKTDDGNIDKVNQETSVEECEIDADGNEDADLEALLMAEFEREETAMCDE